MIPALKKNESHPLTQFSQSKNRSREFGPKDFPLSPYCFGHKWLNFGVVKKNKNYIFYRSSFLGKRGLHSLHKHLNASKLPFPKTIIYMGRFGYQKIIPWFGRFAIEEMLEMKTYGHTYYHSFDPIFPTYLDGHNPYSPRKLDLANHIDRDAQKLIGLEPSPILPPAPYGNSDDLIRILKLILDPKNSPVLFHCFAGMHRTGMVAQILRYIEGGAWLENSLFAKLFSTNLGPIEFEYYLHGRIFARKENIKFVQKFVHEDPRFLDLRKKHQYFLQSL